MHGVWGMGVRCMGVRGCVSFHVINSRSGLREPGEGIWYMVYRKSSASRPIALFWVNVACYTGVFAIVVLAAMVLMQAPLETWRAVPLTLMSWTLCGRMWELIDVALVWWSVGVWQRRQRTLLLLS